MTPGAPGRGYKTRKWNQDIIYFLLIDRFMDGDPGNNIPPGSDPELYDTAQKNLDRYHGGDLRGLELALQNNYFTDLGVTALWITPPVRNTWYSKVEDKSGYHGYWAQDFLDIDPHVVSRTKLGGGEYPDTREGRLEHYRDVIRLAHQKNIKVIQDVVMNHAGPVFYYDVNGNGQFDQDYTDKNNSEWIQPYLPDGRHTNTKWADIGKWNMAKVGPAAGEIIKLSGSRPVKLNTSGIFQSFDAYTRKGYRDGSLGKSDGEEVECDFFALRDFWTSKKNPVFDKLVDEFVEIYGFYIQELGVDGLRIDT
ncbi:MAG TPA: alpha-amylase family glycosyl hydrolase, partial [Acidobacteriota bacterium]|nr:alpha-amylase family glycosyl hydrolase [Acidobacteriota bacterium]